MAGPPARAGLAARCVRNAAHDSICACSVDDVVDAVLHRFAEARQIAEGVAGRALGALARSMAEPGPVVVNPAARARSGVVELVVGAEDPPAPEVQVLSERFGLPGSMTLDAETVRTILGMLQGPKIDNDAWVQDVVVEEDDTGIDLTVSVGPEERPNVPIAEVKQDLYTRLGARPGRGRAGAPRPAAHPADRRPGGRGAGVRLARPSSPAALAHPVTVTERRDGSVTVWPTAWSPWSSTRRPARSRSTGRRASAAWSTAATWATPTTTPRPGPTRWSRRPSRCRCRWVERGPVRATRGDHRHLPLARPRRRRRPRHGSATTR